MRVASLWYNAVTAKIAPYFYFLLASKLSTS